MIAASNLKYVLQKIQCDIYYPVQEGFLFLVVFFFKCSNINNQTFPSELEGIIYLTRHLYLKNLKNPEELIIERYITQLKL